MPRTRTSPLANAIESFDAAHVYVLKPMTMRTYLGSLRRFLEFVGSESRVEDVTSEHVDRYIASVMDHRFMARNDYRALRRFSKWAVKAGYLPVDPLLSTEAPRTPKWRPKPLADNIVRLVVESAGDSRTGPRDRALILLSLCTAARPNELRQIRWPDDINLKARVMFIREETSKTSTGHRKVSISAEAADAVREYVERYRPETQGPLFLNAHGEPFTYYGFMAIHHRLRDYLRKQGVDGYQAYRLRHTGITNWVRDNISTLAVQKLAGHKSAVTTQNYVGDVTEDILQRSADTYSRIYGRTG